MRNKKLAVAIQSAILTFAVGSVTAEPTEEIILTGVVITSGLSDLEIIARDDDKKSDDKSNTEFDLEDLFDDDGKSDDKKSDDGKSDDKKSDDGKSDDKKSDDGKSDDKKSDDGKSDDKKSDDELGTPTTDDDNIIVIIDFSELDYESIIELSIDIISALTAEQFATIQLDALAGLTIEQIYALDISIWQSMTVEQLTQIALALTAEGFVGLNQNVLEAKGFNLLMAFEVDIVKNVLLMIDESTAWDWMSSDDNVLGWVVLNHVTVIEDKLDTFIPTGWTITNSEKLKFEIDETVVQTLSIELIESMTVTNFTLIDESVIDFFKVEQIEVIPTKTLVELDEVYLTKLTESDKKLSDDFLTKVILNFDVANLESNYKKKYESEYAEQLEKLYTRMLPEGWEVSVKIKDNKTDIKLKPPQTVLKTKVFLENVSPKTITTIEIEDNNDYDYLIASMFDSSEVISDDLITFVETQPLANRIDISFNLINKGNISKIQKIVPQGWTFNVKTHYIDMDRAAVERLTPDVILNINADQIVKFEPQIFTYFTVEQVANLPIVAVKKLNRKQIAKFTKESCAGFTKLHFANFSRDTLSGMNIDHFNAVEPEALTGITVNNIGGLTPKVIFTMGLDILNNMESVTRLSFADSVKIFSNLNVELVQTADIEKFLHQDIELDITTKKLKLKKGKLKLPMANKVILSNVVMPDLPDLNISLNMGGAFSEQTMLDDLTDVLDSPKINFPDFSFEQSDTGIVKVKGSGTSKDIELAFRAAIIEQLDEKTDPDLDMDEEGNYALTTDEGQQITFAPMPKDMELLAEVVPEGEIDISETGEVNIDLNTDDESADKLAGIFDPEVKSAESGLNEGVNIEGTGVDQIAKIVYKDGTMQTMRPSVIERISVDYAGPIAADESNLKFTYHSSGKVFYNLGGFKWLARPELKVVKVKVNLKKSVIKIIQPGKLVELTTVKGLRQLIHIEKAD